MHRFLFYFCNHKHAGIRFCRFPLKLIPMIYGYIRVSTGKQSVANQRFVIRQFCRTQHMKVDGWIEETISGNRAYGKRELGKLLRKVGKNDLIVCSELSRLGRNLFMIMEILSLCMEKECRIWTIKEGYRLGEDIQSKVLAFAFGLSAEIERTLISQRTREALALRKESGKALGRPKGTPNAFHKLDGKEEVIRRMHASGHSYAAIARECGVCRKTVRLWIQAFSR